MIIETAIALMIFNIGMAAVMALFFCVMMVICGCECGCGCGFGDGTDGDGGDVSVRICGHAGDGDKFDAGVIDSNDFILCFGYTALHLIWH
jgi:hypothetical protein